MTAALGCTSTLMVRLPNLANKKESVSMEEKIIHCLYEIQIQWTVLYVIWQAYSGGRLRVL